jgi:hypothetical protein
LISKALGAFGVFLWLFFSHASRLLKDLRRCKWILLRAVLFFFLGPHNLVGGLL